MNRNPRKPRISTPSKLVKAVAHVTRSFHDADRLYGQLTSFFCRSEVHSIPLDDHYAISLRNFKKLQKATGVAATEQLLETIEQKTAPAFIKGYFSFYLSCAIEHALASYKELLDVARANQRALGEDPPSWALSCMREMIKNSRFYAESWLQSVCENRTYRPAAHNNDVLINKSWQAPAVCLMAPFGPYPFKEKVVWNRTNEKVSSTVMAVVANSYEENVLHLVEQLARTEEFNALKIGGVADMPPAGISLVAASKEPPSPKVHIGREIRRKETQGMYRAWQGEYRKLRKKHPSKSDVWCSRKIAASEEGKDKSAETVRKHMKK